MPKPKLSPAQRRVVKRILEERMDLRIEALLPSNPADDFSCTGGGTGDYRLNLAACRNLIDLGVLSLNEEDSSGEHEVYTLNRAVAAEYLEDKG